MRYAALAGRKAQMRVYFDADKDSDALKEFAKLGAVRVVMKEEADGEVTTIFEDWDHPLERDHPALSYLTPR